MKAALPFSPLCVLQAERRHQAQLQEAEREVAASQVGSTPTLGLLAVMPSYAVFPLAKEPALPSSSTFSHHVPFLSHHPKAGWPR